MRKILSDKTYAGDLSGHDTTMARPGSGTALPKCDLATFGAGPFWSVEPVFRSLPGVISTTLGYAGGSLEQPTYLDVFCERSGHAEVVQVRYDRAKITYSKLLETFWACHDPTQLNRQGPDIGIHYRSVIFCHNNAQVWLARRSRDRKEQEGGFRHPIVTQIELLQHFWPAEDALQSYASALAEDSDAPPPSLPSVSPVSQ